MSPEPDPRPRRTLPPGTRPAYRLPIVEFNPNLPPAAFPTLGPNDLRPEGNNGMLGMLGTCDNPVNKIAGNKGTEEDPMDIDDSEIAFESKKSDDDVNMRERETIDEEEQQPYADGYEPEEFKVPEKIDWSDITPILRYEIVDNMSNCYESSEIMGILNLNEKQKRELTHELTVMNERLALENKALDDMQKKQLEALMSIDNSEPLEHQVPGILVFKHVAKTYFKKPELELYPDYLLSRVSDVLIAREYLRRIGLDPDLAGEWSNGYAKIEMDPYGQGEEKLRWVFDTDEKRENGIEQDTVKQLGVRTLSKFPGEGPRSSDLCLKSKLDFINYFGDVQADLSDVSPFGGPVAEVFKQGKEERRSHVTKASEDPARTSVVVTGKNVPRRADGIPIFKRLAKLHRSKVTSTCPTSASNGPSRHPNGADTTETSTISGMTSDELVGRNAVNPPTTSESISESTGYDLVRLSIGPDGAARTHVAPRTAEQVRSAPDATVQLAPSRNTDPTFSNLVQPKDADTGTDQPKTASHAKPRKGAGVKKKHKLPVKRLLAGAWFFHSTKENWKGPPKAPAGNRHEKVMAAQAEAIMRENQKALANKGFPGESIETSASVNVNGDGNPLGQFRCFALPNPGLRQGDAPRPAAGVQAGGSTKHSAGVPAPTRTNEQGCPPDAASALKTADNKGTPSQATGLQLASNRKGGYQDPGAVGKSIQTSNQSNGVTMNRGVRENISQLSTSMPPPPLPNRLRHNTNGMEAGGNQGIQRQSPSNCPRPVAADNKTRASRSGTELPVTMTSTSFRSGPLHRQRSANGPQPSTTGTLSGTQNGPQYVVGRRNVEQNPRYRPIPAALMRPCILGTPQGQSYAYAQTISHVLLNPPPTCSPQEAMAGPRAPAEQHQRPVAPATSNKEGTHGDELMRDLEIILEVPNKPVPGVNPIRSRNISYGQEMAMPINTGVVPANAEMVQSNANANVGYTNSQVNSGQGIQGTEVMPLAPRPEVVSSTGTQRRRHSRKPTGQQARGRKAVSANGAPVEGNDVVVSQAPAPVMDQNSSSAAPNPVVGATDLPTVTAPCQQTALPIANAAACPQPPTKPRKKRVQNPDKKPRAAARKRSSKVKREIEADAAGE